MPRTPSQSALARRAMVEEPPSPGRARRDRLHQGAAVLGVGVLGLGVAGSVALTGNAQNLAAAPTAPQQSVVQPGAHPAGSDVTLFRAAGVDLPSAFAGRGAPVSRSASRPALGTSAHTLRLAALASSQSRDRQAAQHQSMQVRKKSLALAAAATREKNHLLTVAHEAKVAKATAKAKAKAEATAKAKAAAKAKAERVAAEARRRADRADRAKAATAARAAHAAHVAHVKAASHASARRASLPVTSGFHIAARFGDTGPWSRYHTGIDFAAPMGTRINAAAAGVVTHAGPGRAGWAGHYVTIRHADGKSTLYAHMSSVTVHEGQHVSGGQRIGAIGMTGRSFGPHVHFELYPAGVRPGDLYRAVNPAPWLHARGLHF